MFETKSDKEENSCPRDQVNFRVEGRGWKPKVQANAFIQHLVDDRGPHIRDALTQVTSCKIGTVTWTTNFFEKKLLKLNNVFQGSVIINFNNHYNVFQGSVIINSRFLDITTMNGDYIWGYTKENTKHGSKNYPSSLKCYFTLEMRNNWFKKLLFLW